MLRGRNRLLSLVALLLECAVFVSGQSPAVVVDFINIDCGKPKDYAYNDSLLGLTYTSDFQYVDTGEIHQIASSIARSTYRRQLFDLRSFPNGTRNCFTIKPVRKGGKYLVRASFKHGNYDGEKKLPRLFDLYLGVSFWETVAVANESTYVIYEIVAVTTSKKISVCLVDTGQGTPFISALELRPLPNDLYPQADSSQALSLFSRKDFGGSGSTVRYPHDPYDRVWAPYNPSGGTNLSTTSPVSTTVSYKPPSDVMKTASFPASGSTMRWQLLGGGLLLKDPRFHIFLHFSELQKLKANETRAFSISLNGATVTDLVNPSYLKTTTVYTVNPFNYTKLDFVFLGKNQSTLPPILNAAEVYTVRDTTASETDVGDVDAVMAIKASYKVQKNWTGDPCSPTAFMWDGLNCSYEGFKNLRIVSMNLSSSDLTGEISTSLANLAELRYLDLSRNELIGGVPEALASLTHLKFLDLTGNRLNGTIPKTLLDRATAGTLTLRFDNSSSNPCNGLDNCKEGGKKKANNVVIAVAVAIASVTFLAVVVLIVVFVMKKRAHPGNHQCETSTGTQTKTRSGSFRVPSLRLQNLQFTVDDLAKITNNFSKEIGRGGFGSVYHGRLSSNDEVAVKMLSKSSSQGPREFQTEAHILTRIHHKNLVSLVGYCSSTTGLALVYEYMAEGSLQDHLTGKASNALSWIERLRISVDAAQGLEYLHFGCKPAIVHRDVKTNNILLNKNLDAKIADLGLSKFFQNDDYSHISTMVVGTPGYIDPEYYITNKLNEKSDVYSFGIVLLELITGLPAIVKGAENIDLAEWVHERFKRGEINEILDKRIHGGCDINLVWKAVETAMSCLSTSSIKRPAISDVLILLRDCLEMEMINERNKSSSHMKSNTSNSSIMEIPPMNMSMIFKPSAS